ncbi:MAG: hypothetical protein HC889_19445 [Synechococcaceae cyanobacterium SM1_2_3]|nr:hypothetical protein [Synechococcaceae cyanobacterium SM1_2_3]
MRLNFQQQITAAGFSALAHLGIAYLLLASVFASTPTPPKLLPIAVTLIPSKAPAESAAVATATASAAPAASAAPVIEAAPPPVIPPLAAVQPEVALPKPIPKPKPAPKPEPALKPKPKPESRPKPVTIARPGSPIQQTEDRRVFIPAAWARGGDRQFCRCLHHNRQRLCCDRRNCRCGKPGDAAAGQSQADLSGLCPPSGARRPGD